MGGGVPAWIGASFGRARFARLRFGDHWRPPLPPSGAMACWCVWEAQWRAVVLAARGAFRGDASMMWAWLGCVPGGVKEFVLLRPSGDPHLLP
jgi:hypothetical protein